MQLIGLSLLSLVIGLVLCKLVVDLGLHGASLILLDLKLSSLVVELVVLLTKLLGVCLVSLKILISFRGIVCLVKLGVPVGLLGSSSVLGLGSLVVKLVELGSSLIVSLGGSLKSSLGILDGGQLLGGLEGNLSFVGGLQVSLHRVLGLLGGLLGLSGSVVKIAPLLIELVGLLGGSVISGLGLLLGGQVLGVLKSNLSVVLSLYGLVPLSLLGVGSGAGVLGLLLILVLVVLGTELVGLGHSVLVSLLGLTQSLLGVRKLSLSRVHGLLRVLEGVLGLLVAGLSLGLSSLSLVVGRLGLLDVGLSLVVGLLGLLDVGLSGSDLFLAGLLLLGLDVVVGVGAGLSESSGLQDRRQCEAGGNGHGHRGLSEVELGLRFFVRGLILCHVFPFVQKQPVPKIETDLLMHDLFKRGKTRNGCATKLYLRFETFLQKSLQKAIAPPARWDKGLPADTRRTWACGRRKSRGQR